jgi:hypothetical protein
MDFNQLYRYTGNKWSFYYFLPDLNEGDCILFSLDSVKLSKMKILFFHGIDKFGLSKVKRISSFTRQCIKNMFLVGLDELSSVHIQKVWEVFK